MCAAYQVPHSEFLAWAQDDRDKAIWHLIRQRQKCPGCGTRAAEWDPAQGGRGDAYQAEVVQCPGCAQVAALQKGLGQKDDFGAHVALVPTDPDAPKEVRRGNSRPQRQHRRRP